MIRINDPLIKNKISLLFYYYPEDISVISEIHEPIVNRDSLRF